MNYEIFAEVYDELMDEDLYDRWLGYTKEHIEESSGKILELACGTGVLAVRLAQEGYAVTGLDLSPEMLKTAYQRSVEAEIYLPLIEGDMLNLEDIGFYDMITCYCDSLCYLPDEEALGKVFKEVASCLEEGGQFLFDVHSTHQTDNIFPGYSFNDQNEIVSFLWNSYKGDVEHSVEHDLSFFVLEEETGLYRRKKETHKERTYPIETYKKLLKEAGFSSIKVTADFDQEIKSDSFRWFFACKR
ncbi:MAG: class I SAM-dependent methyltransferase [Pisciglobus halotolerans]|nr:class I SAM-dependent methyltransferase [Pisciglobus halotolerans]